MAGVDGGLALLRIARAVNLGSALCVFGALVFLVAVAGARGPHRARLHGALRRWAEGCVLVNLGTAAALLPLQTLILMAEPDDPRAPEALIFLVATGSTFGLTLLVRTLLLAVAVPMVLGAARRDGAGARLVACGGLCAAAAALAAQSWLGHGAAAETPALPAAIGLHVLCAGVWLGGLVPLALAITAVPQEAGVLARRFSRLALAAVGVLIASAVFVSLALVGDEGGWFGTAYGRLALAKTFLLAGLLAFALVNRLVLTPRLADAGARRWLLAGIAAEGGLGVLVIAVAAALALTPPALHEAPVWPFPQRPDPAVFDDPYLRREVWRALACVGVAAAGAAALFWRRTRIAGPLAAAALWLVLPQPNLRVLLVPAVPTSYQTSPTGFAAAAIARGAELVWTNCRPECFRVRDDPTDLTPYGIWRRRDGELYWWLTQVFDVKGNSPFEHGFIATLPPRERWHLVDYFRARVAGRAAGQRGRWSFPVPAPELPLLCDGQPKRLADLHGRVVRLVMRAEGDAAPPPAAAPADGLVSVVLMRRDPSGAGIGAAPGACVGGSREGWLAFSILAGVPEHLLEGTGFLMDADGWLRARFAPGVAETAWQAEAERIAREPFPRTGHGASHHAGAAGPGY